MSVIGSIVEFALNTAFYASTAAVVGGIIFLHQTKPSNESLNELFTKDKNFAEKWAINKAIDYVAKPSFKDWVIIKTATITEGNK